MKTIQLLFIALMLLLSLSGCGSSNAAGTPSNSSPTPDSVVDKVDPTPEPQFNPSLPMAINTPYTMTIEGYEGYVMVEEYEVLPYDLEPGQQVKVAYILSVFYDVPEDFSVEADVFPLNGTYKDFIENGWFVELPDHDAMIQENMKEELFHTNNGVQYMSEICVSYIVPEGFDELAVVLSEQSSKTDLVNTQKESMLNEDSRWFVLGQVSNGIMSYNGATLETAAANATFEEMHRSSVSDSNEDHWNESTDQWNEPEVNQDIQLIVIPEYSVLTTSCARVTLQFSEPYLVSYYEKQCTIGVELMSTGLQAGDVVCCYLYDAYTELHIASKEVTVQDPSAIITFEFSADTSRAPLTFSSSVMRNGEFIDSHLNVHVEVDIIGG